MENKDCVFCINEQVHGKTIFETKNFIVRVGVGLITAGHCMIVSKQHHSCIASIPKEQVEEFLDLKKRLSAKISEKFAKPFIVEYGAVFQSVLHAHMHFIPTESKEYKKVNLLDELTTFVTRKHKVEFEKADFKKLQEIRQKENGYVYYEQDGKGYVIAIHEKNKDNKELENAVAYREYFKNILRLKGVGNWGNLTEEERTFDKKKQRDTLEGLKELNESKELKKSKGLKSKTSHRVSKRPLDGSKNKPRPKILHMISYHDAS